MNRRKHRIVRTRKNKSKPKRKRKVRGSSFWSNFRNTLKTYFTLIYKGFGEKWEEKIIMRW